MLKWAVNQPRPSYLDTNPGKVDDSPPAPFPATPTPWLKMKRHSLLPQKETYQLGKENQLTSTPLPAVSSLSTRTPLLRDLSNIMSPLQMTTPTVPPYAPRCRSHLKPRTVYASTLPTFEAEYSPSYRTNEDANGNGNENNIIPGPLLALRGMGIPDSYFEKPRYLEQKQIPLPCQAAASVPATDPTLSSTQMGDVTLERMIDAILESTRKPPAPGAGRRGRVGGGRTRTQGQRLRSRPSLISMSTSATHSPTYRPAFDPASDLCEYWKSSPSAAPSFNPDVFEEREVRSPQPATTTATGSGSGVREQGKRRSLQLRRQRVVRRKRKITTKISSSVRQSAQKLLAAASRSAQKLPSSSHSRSRSKQRHISPDSGHNSELEEDLGLGLGLGLGDEELEASCKLDAIWMHTDARDATKRRLSFSLSDDS